MLNYISALLNYISAMVNYISAMLHFISAMLNKEIIHGRHRVVQNDTWAGPLYSNFTPSESEGENLRI
jgi:hypothetical protein